MNLAQFQIILQKINALDKNINMDGKISSIEKDLMKAYVSQLYEACVSGDAVEASTSTPAVQNTVAPEVQAPPVQTPPPAPMQQNVVQSPPKPAQNPTPVQQPVETVQPAAKAETVAPVAPVKPLAKVQNKIAEVNERIEVAPKTVADALTQNKGKSINDRLADSNSKKTFNDKFTESAKVSSIPSAPVLVKIPDSIKHLDNSNSNQSQPTVNTPPPAPVQQKVTTPPPPPAPVEQKVTPPPAPVQTQPLAPATNVNAAYALFEAAMTSENADKWGSTPIADLGKSIGLNDKISMIKELFSDDQHAFNNALTQLNNIGGFEQAKDYMMRNLITVYNWNQGTKSERAMQFINLVRRRYK